MWEQVWTAGSVKAFQPLSWIFISASHPVGTRNCQVWGLGRKVPLFGISPEVVIMELIHNIDAHSVLHAGKKHMAGMCQKLSL